MANSWTFPRMRCEIRGCVTPRRRAAWAWAQPAVADVAVDLAHELGTHPHILSLGGGVLDRIPHAGERFGLRLPISSNSARYRCDAKSMSRRLVFCVFF